MLCSGLWHVCLTTGPYPLPKRVLHRVRSVASSFNFQYPHLPVRTSSSCWRLHPRLPVTSNFPCILPSIACLEGISYAMWRRVVGYKIGKNFCRARCLVQRTQLPRRWRRQALLNIIKTLRVTYIKSPQKVTPLFIVVSPRKGIRIEPPLIQWLEG